MFLTLEQKAQQTEEEKQAKSLAFKNVFLCQVEKVEKLSEKIDLLKKEANLTEEETAILKYYQ